MTTVDPSYYEDVISRLLSGRRLIVCADNLVAAHAQGQWFRTLGAGRPFLVSGSTGTGDLPAPDDAEWFVVGCTGATLMEQIRCFERALQHPPAALLEAINAYDPDGDALVIGSIFQPAGQAFGRRTYGTREPAWEALEDKMVIDDILDDAGIVRAPREIVAADADALRAAHTRLDRGLGTAMAGDARDGWWGGAEFLRWARDAADIDDAARFFAQHCDRVRVMPFLDGVPCSVHGVVFPDTVAVFRPVEMLTLRRAEPRLLYTGTATYWDPPDAGREQMREAARTLGAHLRERVGYRGTFTLDGVMTHEGFRPTELNARAGAGLTPLASASGVPIPFLSRLVAEREDVDLHPAALEALVLEGADATRRGACYTVVDHVFHDSVERPVDSDGLDGHIVSGPSGVGGFVSYRPRSANVAVGPSFAPTAVRAFAYMDEHIGTSFGELRAATDYR